MRGNDVVFFLAYSIKLTVNIAFGKKSKGNFKAINKCKKDN
jgi:hypothetical protein